MCAMLQKDDNNRNSFDIYVSRAQNDSDQKLSLFFAQFFFSTRWFMIFDGIVCSNMIYIKWKTIYEDNKTAKRTNERNGIKKKIKTFSNGCNTTGMALAKSKSSEQWIIILCVWIKSKWIETTTNYCAANHKMLRLPLLIYTYNS